MKKNHLLLSSVFLAFGLTPAGCADSAIDDSNEAGDSATQDTQVDTDNDTSSDGDGDGEPPGDGDGEPPGDGDGQPAGDGDGDLCGDGVVDNGEECDDQNMIETDACTNDCTIATCGDGIIWEDHETCDDQNMIETDACTNACQLAICGDGIVWRGVETCDDGNFDDDDDCPGSCEPAHCGDGFVHASEECDDGNLVDDDSCTTECVNNARWSCMEILDTDPNAPNGAYVLSGEGEVDDFEVYCDMATDGGGWTIVWSTTGGDNEQIMTSDVPDAGDPLGGEAFNLTRAQKVIVADRSSEGLVRRSADDTWLRVDSALFDANLTEDSQHWHQAATITASDGTSANGFIGYSNFEIADGGDYSISMIDGNTGGGYQSVNGVDHHSEDYIQHHYYHLNYGCQRQYLYSCSHQDEDGDGHYGAMVALGEWSSTQCSYGEGGGLAIWAAMR